MRPFKTSVAILLALVVCALGGTASPLWGQSDGTSAAGNSPSRGRSLGQSLAPRPSRANAGLQRGPSGEFYSLTRNSIGAKTSSEIDVSTAINGRQGSPAARSLGQSLAPRSSPAEGRLQYGPSGEFHGLAGNANSAKLPQPSGETGESTARGGRPEASGERRLSQPPTAEVQPEANAEEVAGEAGTASAAAPPVDADTTRPLQMSLQMLPSTGPSRQPGQADVFSPDLSADLTRWARAGGMRASASVQAYLRGDSLVIQGTVDSLDQRELIESLALLSPGVWSVDNRLTIAAQPASSDGSPPSQPVAAPKPVGNLPLKAK